MNALGDIRHIALWSSTGHTDVRPVARRLRESGFQVVVSDPRRGATNGDVDLVVGFGDPALAADHARHAGIPLLLAESDEHVVDVLTGDLSVLITRRHHVVQLRADRTRVRAVLADAHLTVSIPGSIIHIRDRHRDHAGLAVRVITSDPLRIGDISTPRPDRPVLRVERSSGVWSEAIPLQRHSRLIARTHRAAKLHVVSDGGRHAGLADTFEVGPIVPLTIVETSDE